MGACFECRWMKLEPFEGTEFTTCTRPEVKRHYPVIFCSVERDFESGCGREGRFFDDGAKGEAVRRSEARSDIDLKGSRISWVEFVMQGRRKPY